MTVNQAWVFLFVFGLFFNLLIDREITKNAQHGLTAIWVVIGVSVTLLICSLVTVDDTYVFCGDEQLTYGQHAAWLVFRLFIGSGLPMVFGSFRRYLLGR